MSGFNNIWFQRSKVALSRREQCKIYPNLVTEYLSCYLDPGVTIYCEQRFFIDEQISLTKNGGKWNSQGKKLSTCNDLAMFGTWSSVKALKYIYDQKKKG